MKSSERTILIIASFVLGGLGALGFILSKSMKNNKSSFLTIASKCLIAVGIFLLALSVFFLNEAVGTVNLS